MRALEHAGDGGVVRYNLFPNIRGTIIRVFIGWDNGKENGNYRDYR